MTTKLEEKDKDLLIGILKLLNYDYIILMNLSIIEGGYLLCDRPAVLEDFTVEQLEIYMKDRLSDKALNEVYEKLKIAGSY